jgi:hypothetical protein
MQTIEETADAVERNLARNLRRQVDEWNPALAGARTCGRRRLGRTARRRPSKAGAPTR